MLNKATCTFSTGDNLDILHCINYACAELIYPAPMFNANAAYAVPITSQAAGAITLCRIQGDWAIGERILKGKAEQAFY